ncbi:UDP-glucuronosyltransferase 2C1 isoform X2 [Acyrthosiphon pisum]|uniref:UDP-glucuronosyltransferase n=1 Tax=Acyrthosiphon pisum TaxID=7029 RepID=A0A8R2AHX0_ACYPI|nr:UDP-glucuronosyltransferase 2C1 isoform X2 [Acyrthosiphon pisum]|eukprot:XP_003247381.1 PREDICTED: UDP-glucuronosyltransferase 2C1 isoform X2 [Acyrthosiphon pisum]
MKRVTKQCATTALTFSVLCAITPSLTAVNVLAIEPLPARSHWTFMRAVLMAIATGGRGHNVTAYTPFASSSVVTAGVCNGGPIGCGYVEIPLRLDVPDKVALDVQTAVADFADQWRFVGIAVDKSLTACGRLDRMAAAGHFSGVRYDVVVVELVSSECSSRLSGVLGEVPLVYVFPSPIASWVEAKALGTSPGPSYASRLFARYATPDTLTRRMENAYGWTVMAALQWFHERGDDQVGHRKPSVTFVNTDLTVEKPVPVVQNMIGVGGVHLLPPEPIPSDILQFIEESPNGVIFFTFGTVVALSTLPDHIQIAFKNALAEVPQRVLLKYEGEMTDKPNNVMTSKWLPQRDILKHPNVKLFIGHGGISGVYEAVDAGVPILGFPLFYDQPRNMANLVDAGMALSMDLFSVTKDTLIKAINEIVNNETYSKNAKKTSELFKDRPMTPAESVVYWTEYVIRHKGAPHLRSHALNLTWYQYFLLDIIAVVLLVIVSVCYIAFKTLQLIKKLIFKLSSTSKSKPD